MDSRYVAFFFSLLRKRERGLTVHAAALLLGRVLILSYRDLSSALPLVAQARHRARCDHRARGSVRCEQLGGFCRAEDGLEQKIMRRFGTQTITVA